LKPSERVPLTLAHHGTHRKTGIPKGREHRERRQDFVDALCDHPSCGRSACGFHAGGKQFPTLGARGTRMQCQGGAKNHVIVLPDADMLLSKQKIISDSAFGCRRAAVAWRFSVGLDDWRGAKDVSRCNVAEAASSSKSGFGLVRCSWGACISPASKKRIESLIAQAFGWREAACDRPQSEKWRA